MQPPQSPAAADAPQSLWAELRDAIDRVRVGQAAHRRIQAPQSGGLGSGANLVGGRLSGFLVIGAVVHHLAEA